MKRKTTVTPQNYEAESSVPSAQLLPVIPGDLSSESSSNPSDTGNLPSYRPPGVVPSTPTPPPSATVASPSLTKSLPTSPQRKTPNPPAPSPSSEEEPAKDPVMGSGGIDYLNYAARVFSDEKFRDYYEHRAAHLIELHGDALLPTTAEKLSRVLHPQGFSDGSPIEG